MPGMRGVWHLIQADVVESLKKWNLRHSEKELPGVRSNVSKPLQITKTVNLRLHVEPERG